MVPTWLRHLSWAISICWIRIYSPASLVFFLLLLICMHRCRRGICRTTFSSSAWRAVVINSVLHQSSLSIAQYCNRTVTWQKYSYPGGIRPLVPYNDNKEKDVLKVESHSSFGYIIITLYKIIGQRSESAYYLLFSFDDNPHSYRFYRYKSVPAANRSFSLIRSNICSSCPSSGRIVIHHFPVHPATFLLSWQLKSPARMMHSDLSTVLSSFLSCWIVSCANGAHVRPLWGMYATT